MNEREQTRAKILGVLIADARSFAGRTPANCAEALNITEAEYLSFEDGSRAISLPQLEALSIFLNVSVTHFWGDRTLGNYPPANYDQFISERQYTLGKQIAQARELAELSIEDISRKTDIPASKLTAFEAGERRPTLFDLDRIAEAVSRPTLDFVGIGHPTLIDHETRQKRVQRFEKLDPAVQDFAVEPLNQGYIEIAMRLSKMDVNSLRTIAENILNITF